ncbi:hypothetical protein AHiyo4_20990 [Arthrobacter sp. Hiyo4]|nr:hypothetical protein AHiyo4_20990 [Arthrobacter sp. Hiyo4]
MNQLPDLDGNPIDNANLEAHVEAMPVSERIEMSQQVLVLEAVRTYYFAKAFRMGIRELATEIPESDSHPMTMMGKDLMRLAVINVASVNNKGSRTKSLPNTLGVLKAALSGLQVSDAEAAISLIDEISKSINADTQLPLKYLRHMRNKWAGHASLDRHVDDWADAGSTLSLPLIEEGLARLVNAHQDLSEVLNMSAEARRVAAEAVAKPAVIDGIETVPMTFDWSSAVVIAEVVRDAAKNSATRMAKRLVARS